SGARDLVHDTPSVGRILIDPLDPKTDDRRYGNSPAASDISTSRRAVRVDEFRLEGPPPRRWRTPQWMRTRLAGLIESPEWIRRVARCDGDRGPPGASAEAGR